MDKNQYRKVIFVLASICAIGPFSTDMYLPGFPAIAKGLAVDISKVGFTLTSFFIGISLGQLAYGPLMDRFGRKRPIIYGLIIYIAASIGCALTPSIQFLVAMRFLAAVGGCVGMVGSRAIVRDLFSGKEMARVLSLLMMIYGVAPIVAPTIGGLINTYLGWRYIFLVLAIITTIILIGLQKFLKESKGPDRTISLIPKNIMVEYMGLFKSRIFTLYGITCATGTGGFFAYITGSPFVYMNLLGFTEREFGWVYGLNVMGLITANQINRLLLKRLSSENVLFFIVSGQLCTIIVLLLLVSFGFSRNIDVVILIFLFLVCFGFVNANAIALALQPFDRNAGAASALIGGIQMVTGAISSGLVSTFHNGTMYPMIGIMSFFTLIGLLSLIAARRGERGY
ncbi:MAG: multidrug effflux MFS transporter [Syntrophorhabdaceae bacterium]|nr:multidrug effflux MFS transporter [Syntrophorhabdaceae bacterium]